LATSIVPRPPFIDRGRELEILERLWRKPGFKLVLVYGRRRVGKTRLLREWLRGKRGAYYLLQAPRSGGGRLHGAGKGGAARRHRPEVLEELDILRRSHPSR